MTRRMRMVEDDEEDEDGGDDEDGGNKEGRWEQRGTARTLRQRRIRRCFAICKTIAAGASTQVLGDVAEFAIPRIIDLQFQE
jgi:hypothetical protein